METIDWITNNSIKIEDSNPDSELKIFKENTPAKFVNAKIYGFGEASHNTKEFFDLKAKFFKYLVKTQGVRSFIMEESYQGSSGINEWISGGKGDITTIAKNFNISFYKRFYFLILSKTNAVFSISEIFFAANSLTFVLLILIVLGKVMVLFLKNRFL